VSSNGQLAPHELVLVPNNENVSTYGNQYVAAEVLPYLLAAAAEFRQQAGQKLYLKEGYRSLTAQAAIFVLRYVVAIIGLLWDGRRWTKRPGQATAAVPGTSIHGYGRAIDIWSGIDSSFGSRNHLTWVTVAAKYGWLNTGSRFGEPWHQEWDRARVLAAVAAPVTVIHPIASGGELVATPDTPEYQEEPMTVLITSPRGQSIDIPGVGIVPMSPDDVKRTKVTSGPGLQVLETTAGMHERIEFYSALRRGDRVIVSVQGSGYALIEGRSVSVIKNGRTLEVLRKTAPPEITVTQSQFNDLTKGL